jgi:D-lactate dehydrogenase
VHIGRAYEHPSPEPPLTTGSQPVATPRAQSLGAHTPAGEADHAEHGIGPVRLLGRSSALDTLVSMRLAIFSTKPYDRRSFDAANAGGHDLFYFEERLHTGTVSLAEGFEAVCVFANDVLDRPTLTELADAGTRLVALRCSGYNNVDLDAAAELGMTVARVPAYSPEAIAEHTIGLALALERKIHRAHARVREGNLSLEGLLGRNLHGRTVGVVGTGRIGALVARIFGGFGCEVVAHDITVNEDLVQRGVHYLPLADLFATSDIITLHCPLTPETHHMIDATALEAMRDGVMIINTSRGALIDTAAVIEALKSGKVGNLGLDVYEEEGDLFFQDLSDQVIQDDVFSRLLTLPNVIVTGHQAFFTEEALHAIATTTLQNVSAFAAGQVSGNEITG